MNWQGRELRAPDDYRDALEGCGTRTEAGEFMRRFRAQCPVADEAVRVLTLHLEPEVRDRLRDWCGVGPRLRDPAGEVADEVCRRVAASGYEHGDLAKGDVELMVELAAATAVARRGLLEEPGPPGGESRAEAAAIRAASLALALAVRMAAVRAQRDGG